MSVTIGHKAYRRITRAIGYSAEAIYWAWLRRAEVGGAKQALRSASAKAAGRERLNI